MEGREGSEGKQGGGSLDEEEAGGKLLERVKEEHLESNLEREEHTSPVGLAILWDWGFGSFTPEMKKVMDDQEKPPWRAGKDNGRGRDSFQGLQPGRGQQHQRTSLTLAALPARALAL